MEIIHSIALDFAKDTEPITIFAKQGDANTRYVEITPLNDGKKYTLESGITARLHITKPDGKIVLNDASISGSVIKAELTKQSLAVFGMARAEIGLYKGTSLLSSQIFFIRIERKAYDDGAVESSDEYKALVDALANVDAAVQQAQEAVRQAQQAVKSASDIAAQKLDKSAVVQTTGNSQTNVMSQNAVTVNLAEIKDSIKALGLEVVDGKLNAVYES